MTLFNVHLYREMRLFFPGIEADTPEAAAAIARERLTGDADDIEDCDGETFAALVDVVGDTQYVRSVVIDFEGERLRKAGPELPAFAAQIARMTQDGEEVEGRDFVMENDDAVYTLNELIDSARHLTAEATGAAPMKPREPIIIEVRGGVVQDVLNVPPGYQYEVTDYDNIETDGEAV
jgi:hypothetical protein